MNGSAARLCLVVLALLALAVTACSNRYRRDFGGGEPARPAPGVQAVVLNDVASVEMSLADGAIPFDLRSYGQWVQGHVPGARLISLEDVRSGRGLPDDRAVPLLFMGEGPLDLNPERAAQAAIDRGYFSVHLFPGGWIIWKAGRAAR